MKDLAIDLKTIELDALGKAESVKLEKETCVIVGGAGKRADVQARIKGIRREIDNTSVITIKKNSKSVWLVWPVVLLSSMLVPLPKPK